MHLASTCLVEPVQLREPALFEAKLLAEDLHQCAIHFCGKLDEWADSVLHACIHCRGIRAVHGLRPCECVLLRDVYELNGVECAGVVDGIFPGSLVPGCGCLAMG